MTKPAAVDPATLPDSARAALELADAALGAAGHEMNDPVIRAIAMRVAVGEISGDEAAEEILELHKAGHFHK
jgi:hypothetical protein